MGVDVFDAETVYVTTRINLTVSTACGTLEKGA